MTAMSIFDFNFNNLVVRVIERAGTQWFVLADVCRALDIALPHRAAARLDEDEKIKVDLSVLDATGAKINGLGVGGGNNEAWLVNEAGLYSIILRSDRPQAKPFQKWVTGTVLPSIRKTGGYIAGQESMEPADILARALRVAESIIAEKDARLSVAKPKADALVLVGTIRDRVRPDRATGGR